MEFLLSLRISGSGMDAQRKRMETIAANLANIETTRTGEGRPYRRKMLILGTRDMGGFERVLNRQVEGVRVEDIVEDNAPFKKIYNPGHPDADAAGYLLKPNVDLVVESTNMLMAKRAFEANVAAIKTTRQMALKALEIGR